MYSFSWLWFFIGIIAVGVGLAWLRFYKQIADNMLSGVTSYNRSKIVALCVMGAGFIMMFNLHTLIVEFIGRAIFGGALS